MTTVYPIGIDTSAELPDVTDAVSATNGQTVNRLRDAIIAIEQELGVKPSAVYGTVKERLDNIESGLTDLSAQIAALGTDGVVFIPNGDLEGTGTLQTVTGLQGRAISTEAPGVGETYIWSGTEWEPGSISGFTAGGDLSGSSTSQTVTGLQGRTLANTAPNDGEAIVWNNTAGNWEPGTVSSFTAGGDLSGSNTSQTVIAIRGFSVASTSPAGGQVLAYNFTSSQYTPTTLLLTQIITLFSGEDSTDTTSWLRVGTFSIDLSGYPATFGSLSRTLTFEAEIESSNTTAVSAVQLWDTDDAIAITSSTLDNTSSTTKNIPYHVSAVVPAGTTPGSINSGTRHIYELQVRKVSGAATDRAFVTGARLVISYA